ncbi:hypothetical protein QUB80_18775 [Chlorogloeopsis sp. ULAP01]|uniref:hypothetical protein n=1 Tax=Chlorogloeopsis sp. ULAP01 TaxID=3056483 RepID=UPI0025AA89A5|nr:hypothetical protein [Chlorogloeopsis sp. ULAP01]MDM9382740.1 hypothetical protein [Chlorogloeopsis sp. ULAP01]
MANYNEFKNSDLFTDLSEQEQEIATGGYSFFIQKTDINSFANDESSLSDGSVSFSSKKSAAYNLSQVTFGFDLNSLLGEGTISRVRRYGLSPLNLIYRLLAYMFM